MRGKTSIVLFLIISVLFTACGNEKDQEDTTKDTLETEEKVQYLYDKTLVKVEKSDGWSIQKDESTENKVNVVLEKDKLRAIITVISNEKPMEEIKQELLASFGEVELLEEKETFMSFTTKRKKSVRGEIYLERGNQHTGIVMLMSPVQEYEKNKAVLSSLMEHITFF